MSSIVMALAKLVLGEDAESGKKGKGDPLPPEFRQEMEGKGQAFKSPKTGNKIKFSSLPWEEQRKLFKAWKMKQQATPYKSKWGKKKKKKRTTYRGDTDHEDLGKDFSPTRKRKGKRKSKKKSTRGKQRTREFLEQELRDLGLDDLGHGDRDEIMQAIEDNDTMGLSELIHEHNFDTDTGNALMKHVGGEGFYRQTKSKKKKKKKKRTPHRGGGKDHEDLGRDFSPTRKRKGKKKSKKKRW